MNRLEKKCFVTAAAAHGLLFVILIIGPAFFVPSEKTDSFKEITVFSAADISKAMSSGGTPQPVQAVPLPPPPAPTIEPPKTQVTSTPPEVTKPPKIEPPEPDTPKRDVKDKPIEHGDQPKPPKQRIAHLDPGDMMPNKVDKNKQKKDDDDAKRARGAAEARRLAAEAKEFGNTIKSLDKNLSGKTQIKFDPGIGGGGAATINYFDLIHSVLDNAWHPSTTLGDDTPTATISITISRDGTVKGHITKHSGNSSMDKSVQNVLDTVTSVEPFPPSFEEQQIKATFTFDIKAKR